MRTRAVSIALAVLAAGAWTVADEPTPRDLRAAAEGRALYLRNCSGCHGYDVRGNEAGLASAPDLTKVAERDGAFNRLHVSNHIRFGTQRWWTRAVEAGEMPAWERTFHSRGANARQVAVNVLNLTRYLEFVQGNPPTPSR